MCSCDGLGPEQPSLESGLYVPRVTDWNLKMIPNLMKSMKKKLKKPVFWIFLAEGTYGVTQRAKELSDYWSDGSTDLQANSDSRNFCLEFLNNATYYTLSVTSWTRRRPQPLFPGKKKGEEMVVMANVCGEQFENLNTPVSNELLVKRNEPTERHF